jgi:hypothetical protein
VMMARRPWLASAMLSMHRAIEAPSFRQNTATFQSHSLDILHSSPQPRYLGYDTSPASSHDVSPKRRGNRGFRCPAPDNEIGFHHAIQKSEEAIMPQGNVALVIGAGVSTRQCHRAPLRP